MTSPPFIRGLRCAVIFLTRVPVGGTGYRDDDWRWSTGWFPVVGALIGGLLSCLWLLCTPALSSWTIAALSLSLSQLLTGGFHEDGLADTADALGGAYTQDRILDILKDSRVGAFGAMSLFCVLLLKASLWVELSSYIVGSLILSQGLSRGVPLWLMGTLEYVTRTEASKSRLVAKAQLPQVFWATSCGLMLILGAAYSQQVSYDQVSRILIAMVLSYGLCYWRFKARLGGITGDFLGASQQVSECAILIGLAWGGGL